MGATGKLGHLATGNFSRKFSVKRSWDEVRTVKFIRNFTVNRTF